MARRSFHPHQKFITDWLTVTYCSRWGDNNLQLFYKSRGICCLLQRVVPCKRRRKRTRTLHRQICQDFFHNNKKENNNEENSNYLIEFSICSFHTGYPTVAFTLPHFIFLPPLLAICQRQRRRYRFYFLACFFEKCSEFQLKFRDKFLM